MSGVHKFEAIKYALRQSKDGTIVSFVVHPNDMDDRLSRLPIGARVAIGWVEVSDLEDEPPNATAVPPKKDKRRFADLPASQQAAIRCGEEQFWKFLEAELKVERIYTEEAAAGMVRYWCGVKSRRDIPNSPSALEKWQTLEFRFRDWLADHKYRDSVRG